MAQCPACAPAHPDHDEAAALAARFTTAVDLKARAPERVPWVWEGYLARGAVTLLAGKPKAGKTTITADLIEAIASGVSFLGRPVTGGSVVLVCEESSTTLADKLVARRNVHVLARDDCWPKPSWPILVAAASLRAEQVEAVLVVVDSLSFWAALGADREKDAGATQTAIEPLQEAARDRAVLLAHHQRKGGGGEGEAIRGSSAIAGAVDVIVEFERPVGEGIPETQRQLVAVGRFTTTPPLLLVDRDRITGGWRVVGEGDARGDAERLGFRERILDALPVSPPGITQEDIAETLAADRRKWTKDLDRIVEGGLATVSGKGVKGDPKRYLRIPSQDSVPKAGTERTETVPAAAVSFPPSLSL